MKDESPPITFRTLFSDPGRISRALNLQPRVRELDATYRPWRKLRLVARESGLDPVDAWCAAKFVRMSSWQPIELKQSNGEPFGYGSGVYLNEPLHRIDRAAGGGGPAALGGEDGVLSDEAHRTRLRIRTLMDEAAESSLIEGAATTRKNAIEMLRSKRDPRTKGERMVLNNYVAMQNIKRWLERPLTPEMLTELQGVLTENTLEDPSESRRFRRIDENVRVEHVATNEVIYVPPSAVGLEDRVKQICEFANQTHSGAKFIHPIIKASILHFMIGYEHPFVDGNGRTARAVFYWSALRQGYSIFEYIPISERIRAGPSRYPQAYLDTEQDDGDLTYFVLYQLDIIEQALDQLAIHLKKEEEKIRRSERLLKLAKDLNLRQRLILEYGLRHPLTEFTVKSHMNSNAITPVTARSDLESLARHRLMVRTKRGREVVYHLTPKLLERLERKGI